MLDPQHHHSPPPPLAQQGPGGNPQEARSGRAGDFIATLYHYVTDSTFAGWTEQDGGVSFYLTHSVSHVAQSDDRFHFTSAAAFHRNLNMHGYTQPKRGVPIWKHAGGLSLQKLGALQQWHWFPRKKEKKRLPAPVAREDDDDKDDPQQDDDEEVEGPNHEITTTTDRHDAVTEYPVPQATIIVDDDDDDDDNDDNNGLMTAPPPAKRYKDDGLGAAAAAEEEEEEDVEMQPLPLSTRELQMDQGTENDHDIANLVDTLMKDDSWLQPDEEEEMIIPVSRSSTPPPSTGLVLLTDDGLHGWTGAPVESTEMLTLVDVDLPKDTGSTESPPLYDPHHDNDDDDDESMSFDPDELRILASLDTVVSKGGARKKTSLLRRLFSSLWKCLCHVGLSLYSILSWHNRRATTPVATSPSSSSSARGGTKDVELAPLTSSARLGEEEDDDNENDDPEKHLAGTPSRGKAAPER